MMTKLTLPRAYWALALAALAVGAGKAHAQEEAPPPAPATPVKQVRVQVAVLEWRLNNTFDFDFAVLFTGDVLNDLVDSADLTLPSSSPLSRAARVFLTGLDTGFGTIEGVVETLATVGEIETLVNTSVIVPIGADAPDYDGKVTSGTKVPYEDVRPIGTTLGSVTIYLQTGVSLQCRAIESKYKDFVNLRFHASIKDLTGFIRVGLNRNSEPMRVPVADTREITSQLLVRDQSVLIAGLLKSSREIERRQGIPWISELPILKYFLSNVSHETETRELVFLIKPELMEPVEDAP